MARPVIQTTDLTKVYPFGNAEIRAIYGINMTVESGEFVSIMGPSGSGKSTLLHLLSALDTPTKGEYKLDGKKVDKSADLAKIRREKIGFVFQTFNLVTRLNAVQNVELPMVYSGISPSDRRVRATKLLEKVGLEKRINHKPSELSGGQRQRVAIARALANKPKLILADEPTGNLDSISGNDVMKLLQELNDAGTTMVMVTHEEDLAEKADRIIHVFDGTIKK